MIEFPIDEKRLPSIYTDPLLMDFQLHAQSDKSILSFLSALQALFSCLSNKQDCSNSSHAVFAHCSCTVFAVVAHCPALIRKMYLHVCVKHAYQNSATNIKFPFLFYTV